MKITRFKSTKYIPSAHEDQKNPEVWKKVLLGKNDLIDGRIQMINWAKLPVGKKFRVHYHEDMQEIFIMLEGKTKITVGKEEAVLEKGDTVVIPIRMSHTMENIGDNDVYYMVIGISLQKGGKTIVV